MDLLCYDIYSIIFNFIFENDHHKHNTIFANTFLLAFGKANHEATRCCIHVLKQKMSKLFGYDGCDDDLIMKLLAKIMNKKSVLNYPFVKKFDNSLMCINFDNIKKTSHRKLLYYLYLLNGYAYTVDVGDWSQKFSSRCGKIYYAFFDEFDCYCESKLVDGIFICPHERSKCRNKPHGFNCDQSRTQEYLIQKKLWHPDIYDKVMYGNEERYILNTEKANDLGIGTYKGGIIEYEKSIHFVKICDI